MVVTTARVRPNRLSGASAMTRVTAAQLGLVTIRAAPAALAALHGKKTQMLRVDLRHQERHVRRHAEVAGVGDHDVAGLGEGRLDLAGQLAAHRREDQARPAAGDALLDDALRRLRGSLPFELPGGRLPVTLAGAAVAGAQPGRGEPGMVLQELEEALPHRAGGAQDADLDLLVHGLRRLSGCGSLDTVSRPGLQAVHQIPVQVCRFQDLPLGHPLVRRVCVVDGSRPEQIGLSPGRQARNVCRIFDHCRGESRKGAEAHRPRFADLSDAHALDLGDRIAQMLAQLRRVADGADHHFRAAPGPRSRWPPARLRGCRC